MQIGTVTLSKPAKVPVRGAALRPQHVFEGGEDLVRVRNVGAKKELVTYTVRNLNRTEFTALRAYLEGESGANFKANVITVTDDWSVSFSCRWWDKQLKWEERLGRLFHVTMTFRKVQ